MDRVIAYISLAALCFFLGMGYQTYVEKVHKAADKASNSEYSRICV